MPLVELPLIGPSYTNREKGLSAQTTKNMWPEVNPEARNEVALHNTAGLRVFSTLSGIDRGMHDFNNLMYTVNGTSLYSVDADGAETSLGTIPGLERCVMANDSLQLVIVTDGKAYKYTVLNGVEEVTDPDLVAPTSVAYLNQQFIFDQNNGVFGEFVTSSIDPDLSVDALDFAQAESHPDDIIRVFSFGALVYFFGSHTVEPWQNTGQGNPPFAVIRAGVKQYGIAGIHAIVATSEYMYFLDAKRIPRRSSGLDFQDIGNPALGVEFAKYTKIDDVIAFEFSQDNQQFFALTFPTANRTWVFHEQSGTWFQLTYGIGDDRHRASSMIRMYGLNYCADHTSGLIYEYSLDIFTDNGEPIIRERTTAAIHGGLFGAPGKKLFIDEVEFIIVAGEGEVAGTGPGAQPDIPGGLCGVSSSLSQGQLLNVGGISLVDSLRGTLAQSNPATAGVSFTNSNIISFTCALTREFSPDPTYTIHAFDLYSTTAGSSMFEFFMDSDGYMNLKARNTAGTTILDLQITNDGGTFADSELHVFAMVIDLSDTERRELRHNSLNIAESTWATWNTYTDDSIQLADDGSHSMKYNFFHSSVGAAWGANDPNTNGTGVGGSGIDALGFLTFDDSCSLIPSSVWDAAGYVRDPQGWSGWYLSQPKVFFANSLWKNSGTTAPATYQANNMEIGWNHAVSGYTDNSGLDSSTHHVNQLINLGVGGTTEAI